MKDQPVPEACMNARKSDLLLVLAAYVAWGTLPLYWRLLTEVEAPLILSHRIIWSFVFLALILAGRRSLGSAIYSLLLPRRLIFSALSAALILGNWLIYVWAMGHNRIIEAGLGYFLCPLLSIALGMIFMGERLSKIQRFSMLVVGAGVALKILSSGIIPWVALSLAVTFALYLVVRKSIVRDPVESLFHEVLLSLPVAAVLAYYSPQSFLPLHDISLSALLLASGPITALPLLWLVRGLVTVPLHTSAVLQYLTPSLTLFMGILCGEKLAQIDWIALPLIWVGIIIYLRSTFALTLEIGRPRVGSRGEERKVLQEN